MSQYIVNHTVLCGRHTVQVPAPLQKQLKLLIVRNIFVLCKSYSILLQAYNTGLCTTVVILNGNRPPAAILKSFMNATVLVPCRRHTVEVPNTVVGSHNNCRLQQRNCRVVRPYLLYRVQYQYFPLLVLTKYIKYQPY